MQPSPYCPLLTADPLTVVEYTLTIAAQTFDPNFERAIRMNDNCRGHVQVRPGDQVVHVSPRWVVETETVTLVREVLSFVQRAEQLYQGQYSPATYVKIPELRSDHRASSFYRAEPKKPKTPKSLDPTEVPPEDIVAWYLAHIDKLEP
jgi:hypothetical protein